MRAFIPATASFLTGAALSVGKFHVPWPWPELLLLAGAGGYLYVLLTRRWVIRRLSIAHRERPLVATAIAMVVSAVVGGAAFHFLLSRRPVPLRADVRPVLVVNPTTRPGSTERVNEIGLAAIVYVIDSHDEPVTIESLTLRGEVDADWGEYWEAVAFNPGETQEHAKTQFDIRRPFRVVEWVSVPRTTGTVNRGGGYLEFRVVPYGTFTVGPNNEVSSAFISPAPIGDLLGFRDTQQPPKYKSTIPNLSHLIHTGTKALKEGALSFVVRSTAGETTSVPFKKDRLQYVLESDLERYGLPSIFREDPAALPPVPTTP